jgi:DNA replication protein DnaC
MYNVSELSGTMRAQINAANLPMKTIGWEFSDIEPSDSLDKVQLWVEMVKSGKVIQSAGNANCVLGLLLVAEPGNGKTTLASKALKELIRGMSRESWGTPDLNPKRPAMFMDYPKLLRVQKTKWSDFDDSVETMINGIYGEGAKEYAVRTFVLDDLGKEYRTSSNWAENTFDALLRSRFNAGFPTIVTTNVPLKSWGTVYGEAMGSFAYEAFIPIDIIAKGDRRK